MSCRQCKGIESFFDDGVAQRDLEDFRKKGPGRTTRLLIDALEAEGVEGGTLLDIGGGIGAIQYELLDAGASGVTSVDASPAYVEAAKEEASRRGVIDRVEYRPGNFVDLAEEIPPADVVTLDRVICCYDDMHALVALSSARAEKLYGVVYPRDRWWIKMGGRVMNLYLRLRGSSFRVYFHPTERVDALIKDNGLKPRFFRKTFLWQVVVYGH
ncbi:MAG: class I SAM-dependent methyltransferase [Fidelibacterota bacterium]